MRRQGKVGGKENTKVAKKGNTFHGRGRNEEREKVVKVYKRFAKKIYLDLGELSQRRREQSQEEISFWTRDISQKKRQLEYIVSTEDEM